MQDPLLTRLGLWVDADVHILICTRDGCKTAISAEGSRTTTHLRDKHTSLLEERRELTRLLQKLQLNNPELHTHKILTQENRVPKYPHLQIKNSFHYNGKQDIYKTNINAIEPTHQSFFVKCSACFVGRRFSRLYILPISRGYSFFVLHESLRCLVWMRFTSPNYPYWNKSVDARIAQLSSHVDQQDLSSVRLRFPSLQHKFLPLFPRAFCRMHD